MKAINTFAVFLFACASLICGSAHAEDELKFYGALDASLLYNGHDKLAMQNSGNKPTFLGFRGWKDIAFQPYGRELKLTAGFVLEAAFASDSGVGTGSNLQNSGTGSSACSIKGASGASCSVSNDATQGLVFAREARMRILFGHGQAPQPAHSAGERHQISIGRYYTPGFFMKSRFANAFGVTGVGMSLTLGDVNQGATAIRASNSVTYLTPQLQGLSASVMYALGERGFMKEGDLVGFLGDFQHGDLHIGAALQYTVAKDGDIGVAGFGASFNVIKRLSLSALVQKTERFAPSPWFATFEHLQGILQVSERGKVALAAEWLEVRNSVDAAGLYAGGYMYAVSKDFTLYSKAAYIVNQGTSALHAPGTPTVVAGANNVAFDLGATYVF